MKGSAAMSNSGRNDWATPQWLVAALEHELGARFNLDAAAHGLNTKAVQWIYEEDNALTKTWVLPEDGGTRVWLNPPYSVNHANPRAEWYWKRVCEVAERLRWKRPSMPTLKKALGVLPLWIDYTIRQLELTARGEAGPRYVVMALPGAMGEAWMHDLVFPHANRIRVVKGRVRYELDGKAGDSPTFGTLLVSFEPARSPLRVESWDPHAAMLRPAAVQTRAEF